MMTRTLPMFAAMEPLVKNPSKAVRHENILTTIGATPLVKLSPRSAPPGVNVYVKNEAANPMGSVKDRMALGMIEWAERHGQLKPGQTVIEASSGNAGLALAMVCNAKGYPFVAVMSEAYSIERRKMMRFFGAKVILTNPAHKFGAMVQRVRQLREKHGWFWPCQFENEANPWIHQHTTGPELLDAMGDEPIDYFFTAFGTGGTLSGVGSYLRDKSPKTKIVVCEPDTAPLLLSGVTTEYPEGESELGEATNAIKESHPYFRSHLMQGWSPDFVPKLVKAAIDAKLYDELAHVNGLEANAAAAALAKCEGIFTGTSGGGLVHCALERAKGLPAGSNVVVMLPDTGERYLSTPLFADVPADMTAEEKALVEGLPDTFALPQPLPEPSEAARELIKGHLAGPQPIVIYAFKSCEFCWTISKFLDAIHVPYEMIEFDLLKYAEGNLGNTIRATVQEMTGVKTFPQVFFKGEFLGGAVDACMQWKKGELQPKLEALGFKESETYGAYKGDPFEFLPKWMTQNPMRDR